MLVVGNIFVVFSVVSHIFCRLSKQPFEGFIYADWNLPFKIGRAHKLRLERFHILKIKLLFE